MKNIQAVSDEKLQDLSAELTRFRELRQRLAEAADDASETILMETLESVTALHDAIVGVVRSALEDEKAASHQRGRLDVLEIRLRHLELRAMGKREDALRGMAEAGLERLEAAGLRISVRQAPAVLVVEDESLVPDAFRVPKPARLDYQMIRDALARGYEVPGVKLSAPEPYLSVRTD